MGDKQNAGVLIYLNGYSRLKWYGADKLIKLTTSVPLLVE